MKQLISLSCLLFLTFSALAQQAINVALKKELDSIYVLDQKYRMLMHVAGHNEHVRDSLNQTLKIDKEHLPAYLWTLQAKVDSSNLTRIEEIIEQYGYPGASLVGSPCNEAAFYVIQHSDKIKHFIPYIEEAAKKSELPFRLYAMMLDRLLMQEGKEQLYGTQAMSFSTINPETGKQEWVMIIWPVANYKKVNDLRKKAGFDSTIEENAERLGVAYKALSLEEVKIMRGE